MTVTELITKLSEYGGHLKVVLITGNNEYEDFDVDTAENIVTGETEVSLEAYEQL